MADTCLHVLSETSSKTIAIFTGIAGFVILVLVRFWRNRSGKRMETEPLPYPQSVEIEVSWEYEKKT